MGPSQSGWQGDNLFPPLQIRVPTRSHQSRKEIARAIPEFPELSNRQIEEGSERAWSNSGAIMRTFITIVFLLVPFACRSAEDDANIFRRCQPVANYNFRDASFQSISDFNYCTGFLRGLIPSLRKLHSYYGSGIPNLIHPIKEEKIATSYLSIAQYLGQDPCLPDNLTIQTAALIITRYGQDHPEYLTKPDHEFATDALINAHPCAKTLQ